MFVDLLGRTADPQGEAFWVGEASKIGRFNVALGIAASQEREQLRVNTDYMTYLLRPADLPGLAFWTDEFIHGGMTNLDLIAGFVASDEYFRLNTM
jgi:hypothetical protein